MSVFYHTVVTKRPNYLYKIVNFVNFVSFVIS